MPISFKLNDFIYISNNDLTLLQACVQNKVDIPRFCFHESLSIAGNCRMCLIEDANQLKPVASCAVNVTDSVVIYTNTIKVKRAREAVIEFLLLNHPLDCPICDQGGECDLQDQSILFGSDRGRFYDFKRSVEDKDFGPFIKTIMNRCIHCTRCVRFSLEIAGIPNLGLTGRGQKMEIGFYIDSLLNTELSGNVIDLCPVGALTSKPFAFTARSWELKNFNSVDIFDEMNSNIRIDVRGTNVLRILPRSNIYINEEWITDRIRFSHYLFKKQRLSSPSVYLNRYSRRLNISWPVSLSVLKFISLKLINRNSFINFNFGISGTSSEIELIFMLKKISSFFCTKNTDLNSDFEYYYLPFSSINEIDYDIYILMDANLRIRLPLINAKIRSDVLKNNKLCYLFGSSPNLNFYAKHVSCFSSDLIYLLEGSHWLSCLVQNQKTIVFADNKLLSFSDILSLDNFTVCNLNERYASKHFCLSFDKNSSSYVTNITNNGVYSTIDIGNSLFSYQGSHGNLHAHSSNLILPCSYFIEKNSTYLNMFGMFQSSRRCIPSYSNSRPDWSILNAICFTFNNNKIYKNTFELSNSIKFNFTVKDTTIHLKKKVNYTSKSFKIWPAFYKNFMEYSNGW